MTALLQRLTSRKFLLAVLAALYVVGQAAGGAIATAEAVDALYKIVLGYLTAEGAVDVAARIAAARAA